MRTGTHFGNRITTSAAAPRGRPHILVASHSPELVATLRRAEAPERPWQVAGPVDPRGVEQFADACRTADVVLIDARDLIWLWNNRAESTREALLGVRAVVLLAEHQLLDIVSRAEASHGLVLRRLAERYLPALLSLAIDGYMAAPAPLLHRLASNRLRLDIVGDCSPEELTVLGYLGLGFGNREIAAASGLSDTRVKALVHVLAQKLRMDNRTSLGVFAAANGLALRQRQ